ncbi:MAG: UDP-2-acetamido-2,6-beta-L-arabino-hexul-4-ose reductase [Planctomycetia bacterium]
MRALVTGSRGFLGANLVVHLRERPLVEVLESHRGVAEAELPGLVAAADVVFHVAGINRPRDPGEFTAGNVDLTAAVVAAATAAGRAVPIVLTSSTQAAVDNAYGASKRAAEEIVRGYGASSGADCRIYRLPNVFGKWSRPNYNSAVATFCHNVARGLPIVINDPAAPLRLVYVDDVCREFLTILDQPAGVPVGRAAPDRTVDPVYETTVGVVADMIRGFGAARADRTVDRVGTGLARALYATYLSFLPPQAFASGLTRHVDRRGEFAEVVRTADSGQFSYFTAHPGVTRGGHYHHTKNEKFLVLRGRARFRFRDIRTGAEHVLETCGTEPRVVETVPGWAHDITNIGSDEMVVMLWANEAFDPAHPDTIATPLDA